VYAFDEGIFVVDNFGLSYHLFHDLQEEKIKELQSEVVYF
jgi:hypothetical protein